MKKEKSESQKMQDELEPIWHSTEHDESDDIEQSKLAEGELTEFEKSELERRSVWGKGGEADYTDGYWHREFNTFEGDILNGWEEDGGPRLNNPSLIAREEEVGPRLEVIEDHETGQRTATILKDEEPEEVEWRIVELPNGGFIRRPFPVKKATLAGPDRPKKPWHFWRDEKWEWKK